MQATLHPVVKPGPLVTHSPPGPTNATTGAGKTAIPISLSAWLLQHAPSKRIIFLAPTVHLAQQQAGWRAGQGGK